ncbi:MULTISPECIES: NAD-dependent epimerase [unclassified Colwellia]|uniref:NAD-dependent epimerase n=1 Tax=unclassified Colwellia TaxID=196834 RepID=UPI0015F606C3|nr:MULTISPECIES: NAD-dependent epimerase [unclassified Colwellia]MBA6234345.1 NAD-dependent epimerase [Colwellia sp. MB02u-7]MBA6237513.1 NAD-dependent epimerase [Colwellia sp. MB02u-11]MBA6256292.1 NAD-dependent epimerase [Colwellia sp. MB3u-28]MBA6260176.1 NAD-dependent epimerase [Colwellia sp. MB3u-41]MBA6300145.1 NAD-dependent epimerase [Colwellia sp. MB3u-22]
MKFLVTGAAGFIGFHVVQRLVEQGHDVIGIDNLNDYYDVNLKLARLDVLAKLPLFKFIKLDLADRSGISDLFVREKFDRVIHLAAQAGVRYSIDNPMAYADSNLIGHLAILEGCRHNDVKHLVYASSSSVYGLNSKIPFATSDSVDHPISLYAATKKSNELMSHTYSHLYAIPTTGLRFFTVYGPWGRPDMALFKFTKAIINGEPIDVYNQGDMRRDFTYIDDIVEGIIRIQDIIPQINNDWKIETASAANSSAPYKIFNIGNGNPVKLLDFIQSLEKSIGTTAHKNLMPMQPGDVYQTYADVEDLFTATGYKPSMSVEQGVDNFVQWYRKFYS